MKKINTNKEFNEKNKQGNFTKRTVTILSRFKKNKILSDELKAILIMIINLLNQLNLSKSDRNISSQIKILSETENTEILEAGLNLLKLTLENKLNPKKDFNNITKRKQFIKESWRKKVLVDFAKEQFDNTVLFSLENRFKIFELIGKIETITNTEYLYNHYVSTSNDSEKLEFLLSQSEFIGKTTRSEGVANYIGSRKGVMEDTQVLYKNITKNKSINKVVVEFHGLGGEFSSFAPLLDKNIKKIVLNDINKTTQTLHLTIQKNPEELKQSITDVYKYIVKNYGSLSLSKETYKVVFVDLLQQLNKLEKQNIHNVETSALVMILLNWSFSGKYELRDGISYISTGCDIKKYDNHRLFQRIDMFHELYTTYPVVITMKDYREIVKEEDNKSTLFLNDSPFIVESHSKVSTNINNVSTKVNYGFKDFKHLENLKIIESLKGQFIYYNYINPHILDCVKNNGFKIKKINKTIKNNYVSKGEKRQTKMEVIVYSDYNKSDVNVGLTPINESSYEVRKVS